MFFDREISNKNRRVFFRFGLMISRELTNSKYKLKIFYSFVLLQLNSKLNLFKKIIFVKFVQNSAKNISSERLI
jgi:hypothetical protein